MAFIPVPDTAKLVVVGDVAGRRLTTVLHFQLAAPAAYTQAQLATLANDVKAWYDANVAAHLSHDAKVDQFIATALDTNSSPQAIVADATVGGVAENTSPLGVSMCVTQYAALRGRNYRGRVYQWGLGDGALSTNGLFAGAAVTVFQSAWDTLIADAAAFTNPSVWGIVSYRVGGSPRVTGIFTPVTSVQVRNSIPRYQRRREQDHHGRRR